MVLCGSMLVGVVAGILGAFVLVRQQSLLSDAISHASLPGIITMFLVTGSTLPSVLIVGGVFSGLLGIFFMYFLMCNTHLKKDTILGVILSVFFGTGLVLLTFVQKMALSDQAVLNKFLFGNAATLLYVDIILMAVCVFFILTTIGIFFKEYCLIAFDQDFSRVVGYQVSMLDILLYILLVCTIGLGLQTVGIILMSTMIIAPAAAARQWTQSMRFMVFLSAFLGAIAAGMGVLVSSIISHLPTGPCIIVVASGMVVFSLLCAPQRGIYARRFSRYKH